MQSHSSLEAQYDNRGLVPEHPEIFARWRRDSVSFLENHKHLSERYGERERNVFDLFRCGASEASERPIVTFIHGGYWRALEPRLFSHLANGLLTRGFDVSLPGYTLCPNVTVAEIGEEMEQYLRHLSSMERRKHIIVGHSAGGQLAAYLSRDGAEHSNAIVAALGISGVYDLRPLVELEMNQDLRLSVESASEISPFLMAPSSGLVFDVWVGGNESDAFRNQSERFAASWMTQGAQTAHIEIAGANHFTAIDPLADPDSLIVKRIAALGGAS